mmetsp:Transcript_7823/g.16311  ORF Transcript_7823/g.16311 Transcript_7823/m.16311 type:complete len:211 (+) Transcript_7823:444-1076(+)
MMRRGCHDLLVGWQKLQGSFFRSHFRLRRFHGRRDKGLRLRWMRLRLLLMFVRGMDGHGGHVGILVDRCGCGGGTGGRGSFLEARQGTGRSSWTAGGRWTVEQCFAVLISQQLMIAGRVIDSFVVLRGRSHEPSTHGKVRSEGNSHLENKSGNAMTGCKSSRVEFPFFERMEFLDVYSRHSNARLVDESNSVQSKAKQFRNSGWKWTEFV